jgi:hypothetical protein
MSLLKPQLNDNIIEKYTKLLKNKGVDGIYRHVVAIGVISSVSVQNPEIEILDTAEAFFSLYRRTGENNYFEIARTLRKAAHRIYRQFLRMNNDKEVNMRFLNIVR